MLKLNECQAEENTINHQTQAIITITSIFIMPTATIPIGAKKSQQSCGSLLEFMGGLEFITAHAGYIFHLMVFRENIWSNILSQGQ